MTPEQTLQRTENLRRQMEQAKRLEVAVGLPKGEATAKVYGNGIKVVEIAAIHEYGLGNVPARSILRVPFIAKKREMDDAMAYAFRQIFTGSSDAKDALDLVGAEARNYVLDGFRNNGYGTWPELDPETIRRKGSSRALVDKGILRGSITWETRRAT